MAVLLVCPVRGDLKMDMGASSGNMHLTQTLIKGKDFPQCML